MEKFCETQDTDLMRYSSLLRMPVNTADGKLLPFFKLIFSICILFIFNTNCSAKKNKDSLPTFLLLALATSSIPSPWTSISGNANASGDMYRISCPTTSTCFALNQVTATSNTLFYRTTDGGTTWSNIDTGYSLFGSSSISSGSMSCPDATTCYLVGSKTSTNKVIKITNTTASSPTITQMGNSGFYYSISCPTTSFCILAGSLSLQRTSDGLNWSTLSSAYSFISMVCVDADTCYAGEVNKKTLYKTINASAPSPTWSLQTIPSGTSIYSMHCLTSNFCFSVGVNLLAKTTDGTNWNSLTVPFVSNTSTILNGVHCFDTNTCTIIGDKATIWRTSNAGASWVNQSLTGTASNLSLSCATSPSSACYIGAEAGGVLKRGSN